MRKSYISYLFKKIKEDGPLILFKLAFQYIGLVLSRKFKKALVGPLHGSIIVTYRCNLKCSMCPLWQRPGEYKKLGKEELDTQGMKKLIDDFAAIGTTGLGFSGGEPLLRKDMFELISYSKKKGMVTHLATNGMLINKESARKLLDAGLDAINLSLDGATAATHDKIRGVKGSYTHVINAIDILNEQNRTSKRKIIVLVVVVISTLNINEILDIVNLLIEKEVDKISFIPFHDIGILANGTPVMSKHKIQPDQLKKLDVTINKLIDIKKKEHKLDNSVNYLKLFKYCFRDKPLPIPCYASYATMCVDGYGDMYPCFPFLEGKYKNYAANIKDIPLRKYWKSRKFQKIRDNVHDCRKCYWNCYSEINLLFHRKKIGDI